MTLHVLLAGDQAEADAWAEALKDELPEGDTLLLAWEPEHLRDVRMPFTFRRVGGYFDNPRLPEMEAQIVPKRPPPEQLNRRRQDPPRAEPTR